GATAGSCGCAPLVGTVNSRILTFNCPTTAVPAALRDAVRAVVGGGFSPSQRAKRAAPAASNVPPPKNNPTKIAIAFLLIATSMHACHSERSEEPTFLSHQSLFSRQRPQQHTSPIPKYLHPNAHQQE